MRTIISGVVTTLSLASIAWGAPLAAAPAPDALKDTLVTLEKQSWEAWQKRDGAFFEHFLSDDHVEVGFGGITGAAAG